MPGTRPIKLAPAYVWPHRTVRHGRTHHANQAAHAGTCDLHPTAFLAGSAEGKWGQQPWCSCATHPHPPRPHSYIPRRTTPLCRARVASQVSPCLPHQQESAPLQCWQRIPAARQVLHTEVASGGGPWRSLPCLGL